MIRTAEFVSPKHPDKLCDRISDKLLDEFLLNDENSRCAIETCAGHGKIFITGEVTSNTKITEEKIREIVKDITGFDDVIINLSHQSPEISRGVDIGGAGDQGIMIGYACRENEEFLPQEYFLSKQLNKLIYQTYPYDGKTQVTIDNNKLRIVASFQNSKTDILENIVTEYFKNFPEYEIESVHCNPAGEWTIGGLEADAGLTGRKLAVDNYGPRVPIGGGAFSGKDSTKVDRSAAYMARYIAVDLLKKNKNSKEVLVQISYAIGKKEPIQSTAVIDGVEYVIKDYDLTPKGIIDFLNLRKPIFYKTSEWGHMGNNFKWS
jgi:S-adenosylmethionine synthetase